MNLLSRDMNSSPLLTDTSTLLSDLMLQKQERVLHEGKRKRNLMKPEEQNFRIRETRREMSLIAQGGFPRDKYKLKPPFSILPEDKLCNVLQTF